MPILTPFLGCLLICQPQGPWTQPHRHEMAYRSSVPSSTGFTPYKVVFGKEIILPVDVMLNLGGGERFSSVSEYVSRLLETLSTVVEAVKGHQLRASVKQKGEYDFRAHFQYYSEEELVWVRGKVINQEGAERPRITGIPPKETGLQTSIAAEGRESEVVVPGSRSEVPPVTSEVSGSGAALMGSKWQRGRPARDTQNQVRRPSERWTGACFSPLPTSAKA
ncbi:hypothetical protein F2P79_026041 [Pimephales promelas]|nr:hypothetical protein F2P79_026041 [Pimephales promelas]